MSNDKPRRFSSWHRHSSCALVNMIRTFSLQVDYSRPNFPAEICFFGYNAFLLKTQRKTIAIDPGRNLSWSRPDSLIPRDRWREVNLILVTHAHPDHCYYALQISEASGADIVCGRDLERRYHRKGFRPILLRPGERVRCQGINLLGIPVQHGPSFLSLLTPMRRWLRLPIFGAGSVWIPHRHQWPETPYSGRYQNARFLEAPKTPYLSRTNWRQGDHER